MSSKLILGGALLGAFLVLVTPAFAYDQDNTHPALTDEIVDFYNLSFPDKKITEEEKQWLIQGSIAEDTGERPLFHFFDPVYNRGILSFSSKEWALKNGAQAAYYNSQLTGFAAISGGDSANDFSYDRALQDYAKEDRKRAFIAFGHVLHLFEDAGVPDHTRNDAHPSFIHWQESPYEAEMAKWDPQNFQIARTLFLRREKPVVLSNMEGYFDRVARYSNGYFFSKDTIDVKDYENPKILRLVSSGIKDTKGGSILYGLNKDKNDKDAKLVFVKIKAVDGILEISDKSLTVVANGDLKTDILDGYWERLSKEVVINGAGALRLFLEEAERARQDYLTIGPKKERSWLAQLLGVFGIGNGSDNKLTLSDDRGTSDSKVIHTTTPGVVNQQGEVGQLPVVTRDGDSGDSGDTSGDKIVSPSLSPFVSPRPTVSPLVLPVSASLPQVSPTPKSNLNTKTTGHVIINEIAWAGTEASTADEWIELYNVENYDINISGWTLKSEDGTPDIVIEEGKIIKAQSYFLLERSNNTTVNSIPADQIYTGALGNEGELLRLSNSAGTIVDTTGNEGGAWPAGDSTGKISMERTAPDASVRVNWKNFTGDPSAKDANGNFINGTPKAQNSPVTVVTTTGGGGSGGNQTSQATPTPTPLLSPISLPSPEPDGSPLLSVIINEIGWMGTATSSNDEWMELYNTTNQTVDLTGWTLKSLTGASPDPQIMLFGTIGPFGFYLLERTDDASISDILADKIYTGALSDTGETLELRDASGALQDKVPIPNEGGWYAGDKDIDSSMERLNPRQLGADPANWNTNNGTTKNGHDAAGNTINGTPKAKNSGYITLKPSAVTDLAIRSTFPTINLNWSAPDDLDTLPASLSYDVRYSLANFLDDDAWSMATKIANSILPTVGEKGVSQSASFDIVQYGKKIYFALKTKSTSDNSSVSAVSNTVSRGAVSAIASSSWAMLGKDQYHTSLTSIAGPGIGATISWEFDAGFGNAINQPVVSADGDIYFGVTDGLSGKLIKLAETGSKSWEYPTNVSLGTPAVLYDETVCFGRVGAGGVLAFTALNSDGSKKWDYDDASTVKNVTVSLAGEPYFTFSSGMDKLAVLNTDGSVKTLIIGPGLSGFAPVVLDSDTIITASKVSGNQFFTAYLSDGTQLWQVFYTGANGSTQVNPSYDQSTDTTYSAAGPELFEISSDGSTIEPHSVAPWDYSAATMVAISQDTLYVGFNHSTTPASGSILFAMDKSDPSVVIWSFSTDSLVNPQLVVDNANNIYLSTQDGKLHSVDDNGVSRWVIDSGSNSTISPVLTQNGLIWSYGSKVVRVSD